MSPTKSTWAGQSLKSQTDLVDELFQIKDRATSTLDDALARAGKNGQLKCLLKKLQNEIAEMSPKLLQLRNSLRCQDPKCNSLTSLPDKNALEEHFKSNFTRSTGALIYLDIDSLKSFNDLLSHIGADQIIQEIAHRMATAVQDLIPEYLKEADPTQNKRQFWDPYLFHLSGDEFAILLPWDVSPILKQASSTRSVDSESSFAYDYNFPIISRQLSVTSIDRGRVLSVFSEQPMSILSFCESEGMAQRDKRDYIKLYGKNFARYILEAVESPECQEACLARTSRFLNGAPLPPVTVSAGVAVFNPETSQGCIKMILNEADLALNRAKSLGASKVCTSLSPKQISQNTVKLLKICKRNFDMSSWIPSVVQRGALLNSKDRQGYTALMLCLKNEHYRAATYLSMCIYNSNITNDKGETPLMMAMKANCDDGLVNLLASKRINTNIEDNNRRSLLNVALDKPYKDVVKILIQKGASGPEILPENWKKAKKAAESGNLKQLEKVIDDGWHPNNFGRGEGTILNYAAKAGELGSVKLLVNRKASVNVCTQNGITPLLCALDSEKNTKDILSFLVEKKANIEAINRKKITCLIKALKNGRWDICHHLIELGANIPSKEDVLLHVKEKTSKALTIINLDNANEISYWQRKRKGKPQRSGKAKQKHRKPHCPRSAWDTEARDRRSPRSVNQKSSPVRRTAWSSPLKSLTTSGATHISVLPTAIQDSQLGRLELLPPPLISFDVQSRSSTIQRKSSNSSMELKEGSSTTVIFKPDNLSPRGKSTNVFVKGVQKSPKPYLAAACGILKNQGDVQRVTIQKAPKHEQKNRAPNQRQIAYRNHQNGPQQRNVRLMIKQKQYYKSQIPSEWPSIQPPQIVQPNYVHETAQEQLKLGVPRKRTTSSCSPSVKVVASPFAENIELLDLPPSLPSSSDETRMKYPSTLIPSPELIRSDRQGYRPAKLAGTEAVVKKPNWKEIVGRKNITSQ